MACVALFSLLQTIEQIPQQPVQRITSLQEKASCLLEILVDFSRKGSLTISHLEGQIREASFEAEDIVQSHIICGVGSRFGEMNSAIFLSEFQDLEKIINEFDSVLEALTKIKDGKVEDLQPGNSVTTAGSSRFVVSNRSAPVGLEEDLLQIKDRLTGSPSKLDIISIVGMGGIGKTTLARNLYDDSLIEQYFDTRAWIVISQEYHVQKIFAGLLESTIHGEGELQQLSTEQLAEILYKSLKGRRYLIVMDDIWDTKAWDGVKRFLPDDNNGSRIILTTRLFEVATYAKSCSPVHHMSLLSSEASWNLLREKVFGNECCPCALENIGTKIAQNCKGLPLAIVVIGGLLSKGSRTEEYWEYIAENVNSAVSKNYDQFMAILSLSYNSLPHQLKACFLYMGVFPEDYVIFVSQLIKLWIAEGFVKPIANKSFEEVAEDYLNDLIDRSLIMVDKKNHNGGSKTCRIHDLLRELCVKKAQDEKFLQIMNSDVCIFPQGRHNQRRVSVHSDILDRLPDVHDSSVRSLLYLYLSSYVNHSVTSKLLSVIMSCKLLRVFDALTIRFYKFPIAIEELVHLRYLAFTYRGSCKFPASICKLRNLRTLIVCQGHSFTLYLPSSIWEMPQLRHLFLEGGLLPNPFPAQVIGKDPVIIGKDVVVLENLQTLSGIINFRCTRKVLEIMPNLKKLGLSYDLSTYIDCSSHLELNNLVYLRQLETLKCCFFEATKPFPINLAFPPNLKKLTLSGCRIPWEKMTVIGSLPSLEVLKLKDYAFRGSIWEPNEGEFSKLKFLLIHRSSLNHWRANNTHFPHLQHLSLNYLGGLMEIPSEVGEIPTLEMIELYECSGSAVASATLIQKEQQSLENNSLRVRVISSGDYKKSQQNSSLLKVCTTFLRSPYT